MQSDQWFSHTKGKMLNSFKVTSGLAILRGNGEQFMQVTSSLAILRGWKWGTVYAK